MAPMALKVGFAAPGLLRFLPAEHSYDDQTDDVYGVCWKAPEPAKSSATRQTHGYEHEPFEVEVLA